MSQIFKASASISPLPPAVPTSFNTQDGNAVPSGNILLVNAYDSTEDNDNGITTKGGIAAGDPPGSGAVNEMDIYLTNRATGTVSTADATPTTALTFDLASAGLDGVYMIEGTVVAYDVTDSAGGAYTFVSGAITIGGVGTEIGTEFKDVLEQPAMATADFTVTVVGNDLIVTVIGILAKNINWNVSINYRFVG